MTASRYWCRVPERRGFWRASLRRKLLAFEALWELTRARLDTMRPAAHYTRALGAQGTEAPEASRAQRATGYEVGHVVGRVADVVPFRAVCLQQAIAVSRMLRRRQVPATVYLGLSLSADDGKVAGKRDAHAWVKTGHHVIAGRTDVNRFAVVGTFS
ncbi:MAG: lasso peptide biosynthesis B2 protein [Pseudomonadota bacterium]